MEKQLGTWFETLVVAATPVGATIAIFLLGLYGLSKWKGWAVFGDKAQIVKAEDVKSLSGKISHIEGRLTDIEHDLENRPTLGQVHNIEKIIARMDERMEGLKSTIGSTNAAVGRIEQFMIDYSQRKG
ncbi:MAG: DUF2730 family protein [Pseudomonadota bacterium]